MKKGQRLAEVCKQLDLQPYVLRYWLTEFPMLRGDDDTPSGKTVFGEEEVAVLARIKELLYDEGYTIAGAKKKLESEPVDAQRTKSQRGAQKRSGPNPAAAAEEASDLVGEEESAAALDTRDDERIETLRRGLADALEEARAILDLLQARR